MRSGTISGLADIWKILGFQKNTLFLLTKICIKNPTFTNLELLVVGLSWLLQDEPGLDEIFCSFDKFKSLAPLEQNTLAKTFCFAELLEIVLKNGSGGLIRPFELFSWCSVIDSGGFFFAGITGTSERGKNIKCDEVRRYKFVPMMKCP